MRSFLFVPGDSEHKLSRSLESGSDVLIVDLEDSVALDRKDAARQIAADFIREHKPKTKSRIYVRVNDLSSGLTNDDLAAVMPAGPQAIMLPKSNSASDVKNLAETLGILEEKAGFPLGGTRVMAIVTETAAGVLSASTYGEPDRRLAAVTWGAEDLSAAIGASNARDSNGRYTDVFRLARSMTLLTASIAGVAAVDGVYVNFGDIEGLRQECEEAERDGFTGKMAIHPAQVPVINEMFTPSREAIERSRAIVAAFEAAGNPGVVAIGKEMYDRPHLRRAERIIARALAAGLE